MGDKSQVVLPLNLGIGIPKGDLVFKVAEICEKLDYTKLFATYVRAWRKVNPVTLFEKADHAVSSCLCKGSAVLLEILPQAIIDEEWE